MLGATRFLLACAPMLAFAALAAAQTPPPLSPGWYKNSGPAVIYEDDKLKIVWENSYVYPYPPGSDPLYWYAQVVYFYKGNDTFKIDCVGEDKLPPVKEHMRGTPNSGTVEADETLCDRNPAFTITLEPGGAFYDWVTFHNVPWNEANSEVYLEWDPYASSEFWVKPWHSSFSAPPPFECPTELVTLGTCQVPREPQGIASNLIVLVHGCCTDANDVINDWDSMGRAIGGEISRDKPAGTWEIVVRDWSSDTPKDGLDRFAKAYNNANQQSINLALLILPHAYEYIHFIGHSAGARLIDLTARRLADYYNTKPDSERPFIQLTFLDAFTDIGDNYGTLDGYPKHFSEHYVDRTPSWIALWTNTILGGAANFDITNWTPVVTPEEKAQQSGHHWPRYWYQKSVTLGTFKYGYDISLEGSGKTLTELWNEFSQLPPGQCFELRNKDEIRVCQ